MKVRKGLLAMLLLGALLFGGTRLAQLSHFSATAIPSHTIAGGRGGVNGNQIAGGRGGVSNPLLANGGSAGSGKSGGGGGGGYNN